MYIPDKKVFYDNIRPIFNKQKISVGQLSGIERLLVRAEQNLLDHTGQLAYILATSFHETGQRMNPVRETFALSDKQAIAALDAAFRKGKLKWVSKPYWNIQNGFSWFGRGDVQLTHYDNYLKMEKITGIPLTKDPSLALDPATSAIILFEGMMRGASDRGDFSGKALEEFVHGKTKDFVGARAVVNGKDKASLIASHAEAFFKALIAAGFTGHRTWTDKTIAEIQETLNAVGYNLKVDGVNGTKTTEAIIDYQKQSGLLPDGVVSDVTWDALAASISRMKEAEESIPVTLPKTIEDRVSDLEKRVYLLETK